MTHGITCDAAESVQDLEGGQGAGRLLERWQAERYFVYEAELAAQRAHRSLTLG
jgi:hypothetical protein